MQHFVT